MPTPKWNTFDLSIIKEITIKGIDARYKILLSNDNKLSIYNSKGKKLGGVYYYNSKQVCFVLKCEDGKRRSINELRLLYAYTNDISVLDIPKGFICRTKYGLQFYNKQYLRQRPIKELDVVDKQKYIQELDKHWNIVKEAIIKKDLSIIANKCMECKSEVMKRVYYATGGAKDVLEDCFNDAVYYYLKRIASPKYKLGITLPNDALASYTIKRYKTIRKSHYEKD